MTDTRLLPGPLAAAGYAIRRFPPQTLGVATVLSYCCIALTAERVAGGRPGLFFAIGLAAYICSFFFMRLIDDIDDFGMDSHAPVAGRPRRRSLISGAVVCAAVIIGLSAPKWPMLLFSAAFVAMTTAAPFWIKRRWRPGQGLLLLALCYESPPFLAMSAAEASAVVGSARPPGAATLVALPGIFACCYESWKFSRRLHDAEHRLYDLNLPAALAVLAGLWLVITAGSLYLGLVARLGPGFAWYIGAVAVAVAIEIVRAARSWRLPGSARRLRSTSLLGIPFIVLVEAGFLVALGL